MQCMCRPPREPKTCGRRAEPAEDEAARATAVSEISERAGSVTWIERLVTQPEKVLLYKDLGALTHKCNAFPAWFQSVSSWWMRSWHA